MLTGAPSFIPLLFILLIALYLFLNNQSNLDAMLQRSQKNTPMIATIRRNNTRWLCVLMSLILVVYPLRRIIGDFFLMLIKKILLAIGAIISFINSFMPKGSEFVSEGPVDKSPMFPIGEAPTYSNFLEMFLWCLAIVFLFCLRRYIWLFIMDVVELIQKVISFLSRALFGLKDKSIEKNSFYEEKVEELAIPITAPHKKVSKRKVKWKKQLKHFFKIGRAHV